MIKHVEVQMSLVFYNSADKMGNFLMILGTSGAKPLDVSVRIDRRKDKDSRSLVPESFHDMILPIPQHEALICTSNPIFVGLLTLKTVKTLDFRFDGVVRFLPGGACALKKSFMEKGIVTGRSITIQKACTVLHEELDSEQPCLGCGNTKESLVNGIGYCEYWDDMVTRRLTEQFNKYKRREVVETLRRKIKAKKPQSGRRYTTAMKKTKVKFVKTSSRSRA